MVPGATSWQSNIAFVFWTHTFFSNFNWIYSKECMFIESMLFGSLHREIFIILPKMNFFALTPKIVKKVENKFWKRVNLIADSQPLVWCYRCKNNDPWCFGKCSFNRMPAQQSLPMSSVAASVMQSQTFVTEHQDIIELHCSDYFKA